MSEVRETGMVEHFDSKRGFGFITRENNKPNIFVHFTNINGDGYRELTKGQRVSFEVGDSPKGPTALNVTAE
jgi:CspA family cold shock protein